MTTFIAGGPSGVTFAQSSGGPTAPAGSAPARPRPAPSSGPLPAAGPASARPSDPVIQVSIDAQGTYAATLERHQKKGTPDFGRAGVALIAGAVTGAGIAYGVVGKDPTLLATAAAAVGVVAVEGTEPGTMDYVAAAGKTAFKATTELAKSAINTPGDISAHLAMRAYETVRAPVVAAYKVYDDWGKKPQPKAETLDS